MNDEPEKGPFSRFLRKPIYIVARDYSGKSRAGIKPMHGPLCLQVAPAAQGILPDDVGILGMAAPLSPIPIIFTRVDPRLEPAIDTSCVG